MWRQKKHNGQQDSTGGSQGRNQIMSRGGCEDKRPVKYTIIEWKVEQLGEEICKRTNWKVAKQTEEKKIMRTKTKKKL